MEHTVLLDARDKLDHASDVADAPIDRRLEERATHMAEHAAKAESAVETEPDPTAMPDRTKIREQHEELGEIGAEASDEVAMHVEEARARIAAFLESSPGETPEGE